MRTTTAIGLLATTCLVSGCAGNGGPQIDGAGPVISQTVAASQVDLFSALDPADKGCWGSVEKIPPRDKTNAACKDWTKDEILIPESGPLPRPLLARMGLYDLLGLNDTRGQNATDEVKRDRVRLQRAFRGFYLYDAKDDRERRNRLAERLIIASNQNCSLFLQTLHGVQGATNFSLGSLATTTAGAGAIVEDVTTARSLAGAAAILSGVRAEMNEDFYRNIFSDALAKAIEIKRQETLTDLRKRYGSEIKDYPVEAAVADTLTYNSQCSLVSGLSLISASVNMSADPAGLRTLDAAFKKAGYNATVSVQVTKSYEGDTMTGVGSPAAVANTAEAAADAKIIDAEAMRVLAYASTATNSVGSLANNKKNTATADIKKAVKAFGDPDKSSTVALSAPLTTIKTQIEALAKSYSAISEQYANATSANERDRIARLLRANDTEAHTAMLIFREYVSDALAAIDAAVGNAKK